LADSTSDKIRKVQELEALGAEVLVLKADVANLQQMKSAIAFAQNRFGQINGVIHGAGVVDKKAFPRIQETSKAIVDLHFSPKITGTLVLSQLFSQSSLDFCLMMSSISTVLGGLGYIGYSAACHFLNAWTYQQNQNSSHPWISINWDLWKVGNFEESGSLVNLAILPEEGMNAMTRIFSTDAFEQVIISTGALQPRIDKWVKLVSFKEIDSEDLRAEYSETNTTGSTGLEQTIIKITQIWEEVLGVKPIGITDNFFELGGDSLIAVRLFAKIKKLCGRSLPLTTLFQAQTIAELAAVIGQDESFAPLSSLVKIKSGNSQPPLFCVHAIGGNVLQYYPMADYLCQDQPVYGLQALGLDGKQAPLTSIEDMACHYIKEIRTIQPHGPYFLAGYSFAGIVVFEMAQQLHKQGEKVALLAILDEVSPKLPPISPSLLEYIQIYWRNLWQLNSQERLEYVMDKLNYKFVHKGNFREYMIGQWSKSLAPEYINVLDANLEATRNYQPQVYPGKITLFRCQVQPISQALHHDLGWSELVTGDIEIHPIPGDHFNLLREPNVRVLAKKLKSCLEQL
jgi:thioesterase domain-containing protein/acyl carrier protein